MDTYCYHNLQLDSYDRDVDSMERKRIDIHRLFKEKNSNGSPLKICAPMVRYSSLPFRHLVKLYKCDLTYTHMMLADCFSKVFTLFWVIT